MHHEDVGHNVFNDEVESGFVCLLECYLHDPLNVGVEVLNL